MLVWSIKFDDCTMWKVLFLSVFAFLHTISFLRWLIVVFSLLFYFVLVYICNETQTLISVDDIKMYDDDVDACMWACNSCANFITIESNRIDFTCSVWCGAKLLSMKMFVAFCFCVFVSIPSKSISISIWSAQMYRGKFISINTIIFFAWTFVGRSFVPFEIVLK